MFSWLKNINRTGLLHLLVIYVVWGSTYLAIRVGVRPGSGFTPFALGATRILLAGSLLLLWGFLQGHRLRRGPREYLVLAVSGLSLWVGGNGIVMLAERHADSGTSALIVASTPLWATIIESVWERKMPSLLLVASLLVGSAGVVLLTMPLILSGLQADLAAVFQLVAASILWSAGTVFQSKNRLELPAAVQSGYQMLAGGVGFSLLWLLTGEPMPHPIPEAWAAWGFLVIFGSILAFTSFIQAVRLLPVNVVYTYPFVNPIVAILLGWLILGERITLWTAGGALLILLGIYGVFRAQHSSAAH